MEMNAEEETPVVTTAAQQTIVIHLFEDAEELDVVGPWEVLSSWTQNHPEDGWRVVMASDDGTAHRCAKGLVLGPQTALADVARIDLFLEPGGIGSRQLLRDASHLAWLRQLAADGTIITSVCTGALVLAAAGLLHDRPAATNAAAFDELAAIDPTVQLQEGERFVDDGNLVTSAGVSAGIDMALHLVGRLASPQRAREVQRAISYYPQPPTWSQP